MKLVREATSGQKIRKQKNMSPNLRKWRKNVRPPRRESFKFQNPLDDQREGEETEDEGQAL